MRRRRAQDDSDRRALRRRHQPRSRSSEIASSRSAQDLYFRLNGLRLELPPLRERPRRFCRSCERFLANARASLRPARAPRLERRGHGAAPAYAWPGNVRELRNVMERALVLSDGHDIELEDLPLETLDAKTDGDPLLVNRIRETSDDRWPPKEKAERTRVVEALLAEGGNQTRAARRLGMARGTFMARLRPSTSRARRNDDDRARPRPPAGLLLVLPAALSAAGCVEPSSTVCSDGRICPPGSRCDVAHGRCIEFNQDAPCAEQSEGSDCEFRGFAGQVPGPASARPSAATVSSPATKNATARTSEVRPAETSLITPVLASRVPPNANSMYPAASENAATTRSTAPRNVTAPSSAARIVNLKGFYDAPGLACTSKCTFDVDACTGFCGDAMTNARSHATASRRREQTCLDYRFERGLLGCSALCGPDLEKGCANLGWNIDMPASQMNPTLRAVWGSTADDVFAVGKTPFVHWDGARWTRMALNAGGPVGLMGVWGSSASDVSRWASRTLRRAWCSYGNGTTWRKMALARRTRSSRSRRFGAAVPVMCSSAAAANVLHWDGSSWTRSAGGGDDVRSLWGSGPADVFAAGSLPAGGAIVHFDGERWSEVYRFAERRVQQHRRHGDGGRIRRRVAPERHGQFVHRALGRRRLVPPPSRVPRISGRCGATGQARCSRSARERSSRGTATNGRTHR